MSKFPVRLTEILFGRHFKDGICFRSGIPVVNDGVLIDSVHDGTRYRAIQEFV